MLALRSVCSRRVTCIPVAYWTALRSLCTLTDATASTRKNELFAKLGLNESLLASVDAYGFTEPTPVQRQVIPQILRGDNIVLAASTGSGKTLTFVLPLIQKLKTAETEATSTMQRRAAHPRSLILVPTRELAKQVLSTVKHVSHFAKVSSCAILGGESMSLQKKQLKHLQDIVVASPGRLLQHMKSGNVFMSSVRDIVIDEVDTMLTQGFGNEIREILKAVMQSDSYAPREDIANQLQVVMASATMTKSVRRLLSDVNGFDTNYQDPIGRTQVVLKNKHTEGTRLDIKIVEVEGVHRPLSHLEHNMIEVTAQDDKIGQLINLLESRKRYREKTMIFCNTVDACRAVDFALSDADIPVLSYHGDLVSAARESNLEKFRNDADALYLVCSDIAQRGLDIPDVAHVIMFDFPLNPIDYLHRSGRTGRAGKGGLVTSLVAKRDKVLSDAIQMAIAKDLPIDRLSSSRRDYIGKGKLSTVVSNNTAPQKKSAKALANERITSSLSKARMNARLVSSTSTRPGIKVKDMAGRRTEDNFPKAKRPPPVKVTPTVKEEAPTSTPGTRMSSKHRLRKVRAEKGGVRPEGTEKNVKNRDLNSSRFVRRRKQFGDTPTGTRAKNQNSDDRNKSSRTRVTASPNSKKSSTKSTGRSGGYKKSRRPVRGA